MAAGFQPSHGRDGQFAFARDLIFGAQPSPGTRIGKAGGFQAQRGNNAVGVMELDQVDITWTDPRLPIRG